jgi:hypothetical protein
MLPYEWLENKLTFSSIRHFIHDLAYDCTMRLNTNVSRWRQDGNCNEGVTSSTPKILDDIVFRPLVGYANFVDRVDMFNQSQVCTPKNVSFARTTSVKPE